MMVTNTDGWTKAEKRELARLTSQAEGLEAKAIRLNMLAEKKEKLAEVEARVKEARGR